MNRSHLTPALLTLVLLWQAVAVSSHGEHIGTDLESQIECSICLVSAGGDSAAITTTPASTASLRGHHDHAPARATLLSPAPHPYLARAPPLKTV